MAKKPPARRKPPTKRAAPKRKRATPKRATPKRAPKRAAPKQHAAPKPHDIDSEERLREAMEELVEARTELSRLGHAMTGAHRQIEDDRLSAASARENLRSELNAVRTDLKTALAEAEIARIDRERIAATSQRRIHELEDALVKLRLEVAELRGAPPSLPPTPDDGDGDKPIS
jgi:chromosome segregation ATPase